MNRLSSDQLSILRAANSKPLIWNELSDAEQSICKYLVKLKYLKYKSHSDTYSSPGVYGIYSKIESVIITEDGKAFIATIDIDDKRYRSTFRFDILSLIISIIAVIMAWLCRGK